MRRCFVLLMILLLCLQAPALQAATTCCDDCPEAALCAAAGNCAACVNAALPSGMVGPAIATTPLQCRHEAWSPVAIKRFQIWRPPWRNSLSPLFH